MQGLPERLSDGSPLVLAVPGLRRPTGGAARRRSGPVLDVMRAADGLAPAEESRGIPVEELEGHGAARSRAA